jgi:8-oxo-dGTP pyrophosphatase MutT (NUDIX family)
MVDDLVERLRPRLISPAEATRLDVHGDTEAAVLVPLFCDAAGDLHAVFTRRGEDLRRHAGEVSFPGGRVDPGDRDLCATALREAEEEIGLRAGDVTLAGALEPTPTMVTSYAVYPFVGVIQPGRAWTLSPREVAAVLELRLRDVRDGYGRRRLVRRGLAIRTDTYVVGDELIWGATARIVGDLLERVRPLL